VGVCCVRRVGWGTGDWPTHTHARTHARTHAHAPDTGKGEEMVYFPRRFLLLLPHMLIARNRGYRPLIGTTGRGEERV